MVSKDDVKIMLGHVGLSSSEAAIEDMMLQMHFTNRQLSLEAFQQWWMAHVRVCRACKCMHTCLTRMHTGMWASAGVGACNQRRRGLGCAIRNLRISQPSSRSNYQV
jgi:hypothetical protein